MNGNKTTMQNVVAPRASKHKVPLSISLKTISPQISGVCADSYVCTGQKSWTCFFCLLFLWDHLTGMSYSLFQGTVIHNSGVSNPKYFIILLPPPSQTTRSSYVFDWGLTSLNNSTKIHLYCPKETNIHQKGQKNTSHRLRFCYEIISSVIQLIDWFHTVEALLLVLNYCH